MEEAQKQRKRDEEEQSELLTTSNVSKLTQIRKQQKGERQKKVTSPSELDTSSPSSDSMVLDAVHVDGHRCVSARK